MRSQKDPDRLKYEQYSRYAGVEKYRGLGALKKTHTLRTILILIAVAAALLGGYHHRMEIAQAFLKISGLQKSGISVAGYAETESEICLYAQTETEMQTEDLALDQLSFEPHAVESTQPSNLIASVGIEVNGEELEDPALYSSESDIEFQGPELYSDADGIITFRGNSFRDDPTYGHADITDGAIDGLWTSDTGGLTYKGASWTGSGWTGQPLMRRWTRKQKAAMTMYDWAKEKDDLVEVIYACMDGYIYFLDLQTGERTRDPLYLGWTFKGAGALDPRGYPILYVGAGYDSNEGNAHAFIISLVDLSVLYEFGEIDEYSLRGNLSYFDSSPLVDAETDTLIWPGENGILYLIHLASSYDEESGQVSISPDRVVKWHYSGTRTSWQQYWLGMEDSCAVFRHYLFVADNGGNLMCMDLNTLQLVWVQDTLDDTNDSPVLSVEDGHLYLYISTSFHLGWRSSSTASIPIWKIDAETGEVIWHHDYDCYSQEGVSGGVQSTIAVGKNSLDDSIYVTVSMTGSTYGGVLACIDKKTGQVRWEHTAGYAWSSPVCVYDEDGTGYVIYADSLGLMYLLDGREGSLLSQFVLSQGVIESSPAVYNNYVCIGTRAGKIWGLKLR